MVMDGFRCREVSTLIGLKSLAKVRPGYPKLVPNLARQTAPEVKNLEPLQKKNEDRIVSA